MNPNKTSIHPGGLLCCCLEDFSQQLDDFEVEVGEILISRCCQEKIELKSDLVWYWKPEEGYTEE